MGPFTFAMSGLLLIPAIFILVSMVIGLVMHLPTSAELNLAAKQMELDAKRQKLEDQGLTRQDEIIGAYYEMLDAEEKVAADKACREEFKERYLVLFLAIDTFLMALIFGLLIRWRDATKKRCAERAILYLGTSAIFWPMVAIGLLTQTGDLLYRFEIDVWAIVGLAVPILAFWRWLALWKLGRVLAPVLGVQARKGVKQAQAIVSRRIVIAVLASTLMSVCLMQLASERYVASVAPPGE